MLQKLWHKKWMNLCLLVGSILLVATAVSFPLYQTAAYDRILQDEFDNFVDTRGEWPAGYHMRVLSQKDQGGNTIRRMEELMDSIFGTLNVTPKETVSMYALEVMDVKSEMNRQETEKVKLRLAALSDLESHTDMLSGEMYSEGGRGEDGCIEVVVSQTALVKLRLLVGETLQSAVVKDAEGNPIRIRVTGVYEPSEHGDYYWQTGADEADNYVFMDMDLFRSCFTGENASKFTITCNYYPMFEYKDIKASQVDALLDATVEMTEKGP